MDSRRRKGNYHKKLKRRRVITYVVMAMTVFLTLGATAVASVYFGVHHNVKDVFSKDEKDIKKEETYNGKFSFLILGVDNSEDDDRGLGDARTDTMLYGTFNSDTKEVDLVSIPRDVYTDIYDGEGKIVDTSKINSAYIYDGEKSSVETVEKWSGMPVDYYVTVDFDAFIDIVDAMGGVEVSVPYDIHENFASDNSGELLIPQGEQLLNGQRALDFARIRKLDNDIKRGERQQEVLTALFHKFISNPSLDVVDRVTKTLGKNLKTNMTEGTVFLIAKSLTADYKINTYSFDWTDFDLDGQSMVDIYEDSKEYIFHRMGVNLELEQKDERDSEDYVFQTNGVSELKEKYGNYEGGEEGYDGY